jgi:hypothetical protein
MASTCLCGIRTESLLAPSPRSGKRFSRARDGRPQTASGCSFVPYRDWTSVYLRGKTPAIRRTTGNLGSHWNAWWAREDSNLQPDRYERSSASGRPRTIRHLGHIQQRLFTFGASISLARHWPAVESPRRVAEDGSRCQIVQCSSPRLTARGNWFARTVVTEIAERN